MDLTSYLLKDECMITLEGTVEEIIYSNEINGYTVCEIKSPEENVTAVGYMPFINIGETIRVTGNWVTHPDYGEQLKVETYEKLLPESANAIEKYLASGVIKGIGPATARKIVEKFEENTLEIIGSHPEKLSEIKGISYDKAIKIGQAFNEQKGLRSVVMFFQEYGIGPVYSAKIYKAFGDKTIDEIKANPYKLSDEIFGIGFRKADRIAQNMGIDPASKYRIRSGIRYVLSQAAVNGHSYLPEERLKEYTSDLLEVNVTDIGDALVSLTIDKLISVQRDNQINKVFLSAYYQAEANVSRKLAELSCTGFELNELEIDKNIEEIQTIQGISLADKQKTAIKEALLNGVTVITGGPGTGKTTIIKSIISLLEMNGCGFALAAPTGRAAKRMSEATGYEAKTIHRLLEIGYMGADNETVFMRDESNPIEADVVIIDEMSMVDIILMNSLLKAVTSGKRLVLAGDVDQLPSVGAGNVLKDIIDSSMLKTVRLTEVFRQAAESMIITNAHRINNGDMPYLNVKDKDFFFLQRNTGDSLVRTVVELCSKRLPASYGYDPIRHIQVLTPTKKGVIGVTNLNIELQKALNAPDRHKSEKLYRDFVFREGDRVMQIKNNYNLRWVDSASGGNTEGLGVFNGDTGIIKQIDNEEQKVIVQFEDEKTVEYDFGILDEIEPAYAITIHKSQGSEFPVVLMPVFPGPQILMTRNLLYTAVTRAKDLVILVGAANTLNEMILNKKEMLRYSGLSDKLRKCFLGIAEL